VSERKTVTGAYAKIGEHERECALRYGHIADTLAAFKEKLESSHRRAGRIELAAWSLLVALVLMLGGALLKIGTAA
jgi:hypothetical protein